MRNYCRKSLRATCYTPEDLQSALESIRNGDNTLYAASKKYNIPTSTLHDRLHDKTRVLSQTLGRSTAIPYELEARLANALIILEKWGFGLSRQELMQVVGRFVKLNNIKTPFKNGIPGSDWCISFRKRHGLSLKKAQSLEYCRRKMTDPFIIDHYFNLLNETLRGLNLRSRPECIWNLDETSVALDPSKTNVVGKKGAPCSRTTYGTGKEHTTVLTAVNATGVKLSPLIVFKGKYVWDQWMAENKDEYELELSYAASKRGWMETDIFYNYIKNVFIPGIGTERPVLVIYDGHSTHVDINVVELAMHHNITILKLPSHTSHLLQPLDCAVFKSFKTTWDAKLAEWQRHNVGIKIPKKDFAKLFAEIWSKTKSEMIVNGFKIAGIVPFNSGAVPKDKFNPKAYKRCQESKMQHENYSLQENSKALLQSPENINSLSKLCVSTINRCLRLPLVDLPMKPSHVVFLRNFSKSVKSNQPFSVTCQDDLPRCLQPSTSTDAITVNDHKLSKSSEKDRQCQTKDYVHTFEEVLLQTVQQQKRENIKIRKKRVATGAEVITQSILQTKKVSVTKDNGSEKGTKRRIRHKENNMNIENAIVNSTGSVRNIDVNIFGVLSDDEENQKDNNRTSTQKSKKQKSRIKKSGKEKNKPAKRIRKSLSNSSSSEGDTNMSVHSDSDIIEIISDYDSDVTYCVGDSRVDKIKANIWKEITMRPQESSFEEREERKIVSLNKGDEEELNVRKEIRRDCKNKIDEIKMLNKTDIRTKEIRKMSLEMEKLMNNENVEKWKIGDIVLARYYIRKAWKYHIGVIEAVDNVKNLYTISYYKTIKKSTNLQFVKPKRVDIDMYVPEVSIVKSISLLKISEKPESYALMQKENSVYF